MNKPSTVNTAPTFAIYSSPLTTDLGWNETSSSISVQTNGKTVVAGTRTKRIHVGLQHSNIALPRYNSNGMVTLGAATLAISNKTPGGSSCPA
ncbi:hypothetical protein KFZ76_20060 [Methylovulum psychrotolerans]|uniref:hypothetical protein n=1 Tax=Methylovulum psychrotolerans TaxID=1704499 RepID=UPI001BFFA5F2|nr:hypothetical protein [Methylovulum psychrotolerans]MBT9099999.1 hypothetical protein [Methylovulum psychrotolerans]